MWDLSFPAGIELHHCNGRAESTMDCQEVLTSFLLNNDFREVRANLQVFSWNKEWILLAASKLFHWTELNRSFSDRFKGRLGSPGRGPRLPEAVYKVCSKSLGAGTWMGPQDQRVFSIYNDKGKAAQRPYALGALKKIRRTELDLWYLFLHVTPKHPSWKFTTSLQCYFSWGQKGCKSEAVIPKNKMKNWSLATVWGPVAITLGLIHCSYHSEWMGLNEWVMLLYPIYYRESVCREGWLTKMFWKAPSFKRKINHIFHILRKQKVIEQTRI